jgi:hypothetical protein
LNLSVVVEAIPRAVIVQQWIYLAAQKLLCGKRAEDLVVPSTLSERVVEAFLLITFRDMVMEKLEHVEYLIFPRSDFLRVSHVLARPTLEGIVPKGEGVLIPEN